MADDDCALVARLIAGDDDAIGDLFDRYSGFVLGVARRVTRSTAIAEDIAQDVFTLMWTTPQRYDPARGSLRAYLGMLANRRAIDVVRSDSRRRLRETRCAPKEHTGPVVSDAVDTAAVADMVQQAITCLPDEQRVAVELAFFKGCSYREVATVLAIPEGTAKSRLRLAQVKLGRLLASPHGEHV